MWCGVLFFFFFQAEDGIRDLVRSRGLGDVYKRQVILVIPFYNIDGAMKRGCCSRANQNGPEAYGFRAVSYTHLTLPTSDLV